MIDSSSSTQTLAHHGKSFYWASCIMSKAQQEKAAMLYNFCRYVDDVVDENSSVICAREGVRKVLFDLNHSKSDIKPMQDILTLIHSHQISKTVVKQLIHGVAWDLDHSHIKDHNDLIRYCYGVASTVGLMMCQLFDVRHELAWRYAIDLGIAMQLTNISRDVVLDASMGRVYIPQTWFDAPCSPEDILSAQNQDDHLFAHVKKIVALADTHYQSAHQGLCYLPPRIRLSLLVAFKVYEAIGHKAIRLNPQQYWRSRRIFTTRTEKCLISIQALVSFLTSKTLRTSFKGFPHNPILHEPIKDLVDDAFHEL